MPACPGRVRPLRLVIENAELARPVVGVNQVGALDDDRPRAVGLDDQRLDAVALRTFKNVIDGEHDPVVRHDHRPDAPDGVDALADQRLAFLARPFVDVLRVLDDVPNAQCFRMLDRRPGLVDLQRSGRGFYPDSAVSSDNGLYSQFPR